jgi:hypothetical protein
MTLIKLINDFINEEYKFNGQQVTEAFKMAVKRELWLDSKRVDPSTFGQHLSVNIVGQVLTAYKEAKRDSNARPQGYNYNQLPEYKKELITPLQSWELVLKFTEREAKHPLAAPYVGAYNYLVEQGKIRPVSNEKTNRFESNLASRERDAVESYVKRNYSHFFINTEID